jgi:hypothetical protein
MKSIIVCISTLLLCSWSNCQVNTFADRSIMNTTCNNSGLNQTISPDRIHIGDTSSFPAFSDGPVKILTTGNLSYGALLIKNPISNLCSAADFYNDKNLRFTVGIAGSENSHFYRNCGYLFMSDQNSEVPVGGLVIGHLYTPAPIIFSQADNEVVRISEKGNVGIGTNNPSFKFDVNGLINTSEGLRFPDGSIMNTACNNSGLNQTISPDRIHIGDTSSFPAFSDGPVKIVTTGNHSYGALLIKNPISNLCTGADFYNDKNLRFTVGIAGSENSHFYRNCGYLFMSDQNSEVPVGGLVIGHLYTPAPIIFSQGENEVMRITGDGYVGIGKNEPSYKLDVDGLINTSQGIRFPDGSIQHSAAGDTIIGNSDWFKNESGNLYANTNIGIGTDNPKAKVEIADGDIFISDINKGIIMKSPDGQCWRGTLDNSGTLIFVAVNCNDFATGSFTDESESGQLISIYPNPTQNMITISMFRGNLRNMTAVLLTLDGKIVKKENLVSDYYNLKLNDIPAGYYLIKVVNKKGKEIQSEKIIKQ